MTFEPGKTYSVPVHHHEEYERWGRVRIEIPADTNPELDDMDAVVGQLLDDAVSEGALEQGAFASDTTSKVRRFDVEIIESDDPDEQIVQEDPPRGEFIARFSPQVWMRDNAIEVDPRGETEWDATEGVAGMPEDYRAGLLAVLEEEDEVIDNDDWLSDDANAPSWVRNWSGPFSIWIRRATDG